MSFARLILLMLLLVLLAACSSHDPVWRMKAKLALMQLHTEQVDQIRPDDYDHVQDLFCQGEGFLIEHNDVEQADSRYRSAYQKGVVLQKEVQFQKDRQKEAALQKELEERAIRDEENRLKQEAELVRLQEQQEAAHKALQKQLHQAADAEQIIAHPTNYTVKRGETLPQIAARPEIYNDVALWPLIYRANRDQIRDPYQLWPGQTIKIPRGFSKEDAIEARRQSYRRGIK